MELKERDLFFIFFLLACGIILNQAWVPGFFADGYLYAGLGKMAAEEGHWLVPKFANHYFPEFYHHPPLTFILEGVFFKIFGSGFLQARLFISIFSIGTLTLIFLFLKRLFDFEHAILGAFSFLLIYPILRLSRFPNTDLPFMFFTFLILIFYFLYLHERKNNNLYLLFSGIFLFLSFFTKGLLGFLPIVALTCYEVFFNRFKTFKNPFLYLSLLIGLAFWPTWYFALKFHGKEQLFTNYFNHVTSAVNSGDTHYGHAKDYLLYFRFLAINCLPHIILLSIFVFKKRYREINDKQLFSIKFFGCNVLVALIFLSFQKVKMGYYLVLIYPCLAIVCSIFANSFLKSKFRTIYLKMFYLLLIINILLLIFPITNKSNRDSGIIESIKILNHNFPIKKFQWILVQGAYPINDAYLLPYFLNKSQTGQVRLQDLKENNFFGFDCNYVILAKKADIETIDQNKKLKLLFHFSKDDVATYMNCE